jgi:energy-coupling factor transporter ATP-binding protein EcfA2
MGLPLIGLVRERQALVNAIDRRESLLLLGPGGSGKTTLVQSVLESQSPGGTLIHIPHFETLHDLLVTIARGLFRSGHKLFRRKAAAGPDWETWLDSQTSVHLKGLLWAALEAEPRTVIIDGVSAASHQTYRFLQRLYFAPGMAMVATARDHLHLGELARLFWDPRKTLQVQPLSQGDALRLFEAAADHFGLRELSLDDFREKVLDCARGNPGQIVGMCRLAAHPQYVAGKYIKFALVRIDTMTRYL